MHGQAQQQAYDRGITIFSPDGRLYQVEYAREAVKRGSPSIGIRTSDGIVLAADTSTRQPLQERSSVEKIHKADDHIGIASAGHVADARQLIDFARQMAQINRLRYQEPIGAEALAKFVTDHIQQYTQIGGARPFGSSLIIGGIEDGSPRLFETDPSGTPYEWKAVSIGSDRSKIKTFLEENYSSDLSLENGIELALKALAEVNEDGLDAEGVGMATIPTETALFAPVDAKEVAKYIKKLKLVPKPNKDDKK
ncbi:MAG TPA: archaeal proteasome endopeptidase complex subunit alpha [Halobacteriales archaeon]|uniref:archaeal proteasome endopeptidase complex subunit alpha n=1 Tax=Candidatus Hikarchaeum yamanae TaxID=2675326 RepID=UPI0017E64E34|nr:archaeal proteasome endopeptidase complex subunit alpha [Halobacteriales archaeon]|tara:strand:- start:16403 stop:17158 length:756 start_codon:yes stop_codon:yes gene_type:complete